MTNRLFAAAMHAALGFPWPWLLRTAAFAACAILAACGGPRDRPAVSSQQYDAELQQWVGHTEAELFRAWGVPTHSQLLSQGGQALQYVRQRGDIVDCTTLFTSNVLGVIDTWTWRGDRCRAPQLGSSTP